MSKSKKLFDKSGIRTHAPFETRKLLLVVELRYLNLAPWTNSAILPTGMEGRRE
jgi:hypothetical protein